MVSHKETTTLHEQEVLRRDVRESLVKKWKMRFFFKKNAKKQLYFGKKEKCNLELFFF